MRQLIRTHLLQRSGVLSLLSDEDVGETRTNSRLRHEIELQVFLIMHEEASRTLGVHESRNKVK